VVEEHFVPSNVQPAFVHESLVLQLAQLDEEHGVGDGVGDGGFGF
jgi:hypothetical protein